MACEFIPCAQYAPEFQDTEFDLEHLPADRNYFSYFTNCNKLNGYLHDVLLAHKITDSGLPNKLGCRIAINTAWNTELLDMLLLDYEDRDVVQWLRYRFSISRGITSWTPLQLKAITWELCSFLKQLKTTSTQSFSMQQLWDPSKFPHLPTESEFLLYPHA